jgi:gas vesicle protein
MKTPADLLSSERLSLKKRRLIMAQNMIPKGSYILVGLGIGSLIGVLFAPKSGEEIQKYLAKKASERNEFARKQMRELRDRADDAIERGKEIIAQTEGRIATAIDAGVETYNREKSKAHVS